MLVSVATSEHDDALHEQGQRAWDDGDFPGMVTAAEAHTDAIGKYVFDRFRVTGAGGQACTGTLDDTVTVDLQDEVPYAHVTADFTCPEPSGDAVRARGVVGALPRRRDLRARHQDDRHLRRRRPDGFGHPRRLATPRSRRSSRRGERFWEFFPLGAEHLLTGIDHILFLVALIAGSRRLREVV